MSFCKTTLFSLACLAFLMPPIAHGATRIKAATPSLITIPVIHVSAVIEAVGLNRAKVMQQPSSGSRVAWFNRGVVPGETGSAVLYGHVSGQHFEPTILANLNKLKKNDRISVRDVRGNVFTYSVVSSKLYRADGLTYDFLSLPTRDAILNLYTCAGVWDQRLRHYTNYLVVSSKLISSRPGK